MSLIATALTVLSCVGPNSSFEITTDGYDLSMNGVAYAYTKIDDRTLYGTTVKQAGNILRSQEIVMIDRFDGSYVLVNEYTNAAKSSEDVYTKKYGTCELVEAKF